MLDLPNFFDWGDHSYDMKTMACSYDRTESYSYTVFFITMFVTIPLVTVLWCNLNIYIVVLKSKMRVATHAPGGPVAWTETSGDQSSLAYVYVESETTGGTLKPGQLVAVPPRSNNKLQVPKAASAKSKKTSVEKGTPTEAVPTTVVKNTDNTRSRGRNMKSEIKLAKTLFIIFIVFVICWAPYALICLVDRADNMPKEAYTIAILFAHSSSTLNSVLYAATNKGFRQGYKLFLNKCGCKIS